MHLVDITVRQAREADIGSIMDLLQTARRRHVPFGREDLPGLLQEGWTFIVDSPYGLLGVLVVKEAGPGWGLIRALALVDGLPSVLGLRRLVAHACEVLAQHHMHTLYCLLSESWLQAPLEASGFRVTERIVVLYRESDRIPPVPEGPAWLRPMQQEELEVVVELDAAAFPERWHYSRPVLTSMLAMGSRFSVAIMHQKIVGYACVDLHQDIGHIVRLAVHPAYQHQGIGRQLLLEAMAYLKAAGAVRLTVNTQQSNRRALRLYRSLGFRPLGRTIPVMERPVERPNAPYFT